MIVGITGHRSAKIGGFSTPNPIHSYIVAEMRKHFIELKPDAIISGMALGVDTIAAELAIELGIAFTAAVPFVGQERVWPITSKKHYHNLLTKANTVHVVSD